jgi:hypothetical protein
MGGADAPPTTTAPTSRTGARSRLRRPARCRSSRWRSADRTARPRAHRPVDGGVVLPGTRGQHRSRSSRHALDESDGLLAADGREDVRPPLQLVVRDLMTEHDDVVRAETGLHGPGASVRLRATDVRGAAGSAADLCRRLRGAAPNTARKGDTHTPAPAHRWRQPASVSRSRTVSPAGSCLARGARALGLLVDDVASASHWRNTGCGRRHAGRLVGPPAW